MNYILYNYAFFKQADLRDFQLIGLTQQNILSNQQLYFEIIDKYNNIKTIQSHTRISGYFTKKQLGYLITENIATNTIFIISSLSHCVRISYKDYEWKFYNSHHSYLTPKNLYRYYFVKNELIEKIISTLGNSLTLEVAAIKKKPLEFPYIEQIITNSPLFLIKDFGLHLIARDAPNLLPKIFAAIPEKKLPSLLKIALLTKIEKGYTVLNILKWYNPSYLKILLDFLNKTKDGRKIFVDILLLKTDKNRLIFVTLKKNLSTELLATFKEILINHVKDELVDFINANKPNAFFSSFYIQKKSVISAVKKLLIYSEKNQQPVFTQQEFDELKINKTLSLLINTYQILEIWPNEFLVESKKRSCQIM